MLPKEERSITQLFSELTQETADLVRQEIRLGKAEMTEKISQAERGATYVGVGGMIAHAGMLALVAALVFILDLYMSLWLSALIVGVVVGIIGFALLQKGRKDLKGQNLVPQRTSASIRRDKDMVKEHRHGISRAQQH